MKDQRIGFADAVIEWQQRAGRHDLPWQASGDPYRIWLAEIMLQQTQVTTVIAYFERFLRRFPDLGSLASAPLESVLEIWAGLGYYSRARNLHRAAKIVCATYGGRIPSDPEQLLALPGIGRSTAAAISAFAFGTRSAILDGNVKRVFCRCFGIEGIPGRPSVDRELWDLAERLLPNARPAGTLGRRMRSYTQGLMDLGATVCKPRQPSCDLCPLADGCSARRQGRQDELPTRKARAERPERVATALLIDDGSRFLLEPRPASGIWGGLLAPPEVLPGESTEQAMVRHGFPPQPGFALPEIRHDFTHFRLRLRPMLIRVGSDLRIGECSGLRPVGYSEIAGAALPAPIRRLLAGLITAS